MPPIILTSGCPRETVALLDVFLGALVVFLATGAGSVAIIALGKIGKGSYPALLSFSAGVMAFSALEMLGTAHQQSGNAVTAAGLVLGMLTLFILERTLPHAHGIAKKGEASGRKGLLIAGAVALHNIPEGLAVASAFASSVPLGWLVTASIALQDVPEGLLISMPLACYGMRMRRCIDYGVLSGAVEAAAAVIGYLLLSAIAPAVPLGLAFSAGAMTYVILVELLPDALKDGGEWRSALSFVAGGLLAFGIAQLFAV